MSTRDGRPINVAVLPAERRSRHPYQFLVLAGMLVLSAVQLVWNVSPLSSLMTLPYSTFVWLNVQMIVACGLGLAAAIVPDGWFRLNIELIGQFMLASVFAATAVTIGQRLPFPQNLTLGLILAASLGGAAAARVWQIVRDMRALHRSADVVLTAKEVRE